MPKFKLFAGKKGAQDRARNNQFVKIARQIFVAVRNGGPDPNANFKLKSLLATARSINMPNENVERAIKKATGDIEGVEYEEVRYEGYGPGGVAVLVQCLTDNRNRSAAEVRAIFNKRGGSLGEPNCVAWMFDEKGVLTLSKEEKEIDEESLMMAALEAGAEDVLDNGDSFEVITDPADLEKVKNGVEEAGYEIETAEVQMIPKTTVKIAGENAAQMLKMMEAFEENDDVQHVYVNFEIDEDEMQKLQS